MRSSVQKQPPRWSPAAQSLEWPALAEALAGCATFTTCKEKLAHLHPESCEDTRSDLLDLTAEMLRVQAAGLGYFRFHDAELSEALHSIRLSRILDARGLLAIRDLLAMSLRAAAFCREKEWPRRQSEFPKLFAICSVMHPNDKLHKRLDRSLNDEGELLDSASADLAQARAAVRAAERLMLTDLERLLRNSTIRDALQDPVWTQREGRYVLPVRTDRKSAVPGATIGVSQTGATIFVEPAGLAEARAKLELAQRDREIAEARVLAELSRACAAPEVAEALHTCAEQLHLLDTILARARFAQQIGGIRPNIYADPRKPRFKLLQARHPLYVVEGKECRANDLSLERETDSQQIQPLVMVLSGPNAGGKTVSMKTIGLIALMAQAGLYVPVVAADIFTFRKVYAEIGDRQSREDDLSTFSAHLHALKRLLDQCTEQDLVLLDEGFVGTDPGMGAALARSVLEELASRRVCTVITTHFSQLKVIADDHLAFMNASMEFEPERLLPTYHFLPGIPGQSYAFELAERLGFPKNLLDKARAYHGEESQRLERLLKELQVARHAVETERNMQTQLRMEMEEMRTAAQSEYKALRSLRSDLNQRFESEIRKRVNAFKNTLEIRERQFVRHRQRLLEELTERAAAAREQTAAPREPAPEVSQGPATDPAPASDTIRKAAQAKQKQNTQHRKQEAKRSTPDDQPRTFHNFQSLAQLQLDTGNRHRTRKNHARGAERRRLSKFDSSEWNEEGSFELEDLVLKADSERNELLEEVEQISAHIADAAETAGTDPLMETQSQQREVRLRQIDAEERLRTQAESPDPQSFLPGTRVTSKRFQGTGEVKAKANSKGLVICQFGMINTKVHFTELKITKTAQESKTFGAKRHNPSQTQGPQMGKQAVMEPLHRTQQSSERAVLDVTLPAVAALGYCTIDLRGMHADVALEKLDLFLDRAIREEFSHIIVLHGHGMGAVKNAVRGFLKNLKMACRYRPGTQGEGGDGVTLVVFD
jgi:DNA mismatch repair protein MutS2